MCEAGDDSNHGSSATRDIECLQALSRRIHYGKFVAESKFQDPKYRDKYIELIRAGDRDGIMATLTNEQVEKQLLERLRLKVDVYGQDLSKRDIDNSSANGDSNENGYCLLNGKNNGLRVDAALVVDLYQKYVIPLTKEVELEYSSFSFG